MKRKEAEELALTEVFGLDANATTSKRCSFGIELEFEDAILDHVSENISEIANFNEAYWDVKPDGTVTDYVRYHNLYDEEEHDRAIGGEVTSPILVGSMYDWADVKDVCGAITRAKGIVSPKCGGHIHFGVQMLEDNPLYYENLLKLWSAFEDVITIFCSGEHEHIRPGYLKHAPHIGKYIQLKHHAVSKQERQNLEKLLNFYAMTVKGEKTALNFSNLSIVKDNAEGTLEVRLPNGTLNPVVLQNNVLFFDALINKASSLSPDERMLIDASLSEKLQIDSIDKFILLTDLIIADEKTKLKMLRQFLFCNQYLTPQYFDFHETLEENIRHRV